MQATHKDVCCSPDTAEVYEITSCQNGLLLIQIVLLRLLFLCEQQ